MTSYKFRAEKSLANGRKIRVVGVIDAPNMHIAHQAIKMRYPGHSISVFGSQKD